MIEEGTDVHICNEITDPTIIGNASKCRESRNQKDRRNAICDDADKSGNPNDKMRNLGSEVETKLAQ